MAGFVCTRATSGGQGSQSCDTVPAERRSGVGEARRVQTESGQGPTLPDEWFVNALASSHSHGHDMTLCSD